MDPIVTSGFRVQLYFDSMRKGRSFDRNGIDVRALAPIDCMYSSGKWIWMSILSQSFTSATQEET